MLEHFHASHCVKTLRLLLCQGFDAKLPVLNIGCLRFERVQLCHSERLGGQVNTGHLGTATRHGVGQNAAATPYIQNLLPLIGEWLLIQSSRKGLI